MLSKPAISTASATGSAFDGAAQILYALLTKIYGEIRNVLCVLAQTTTVETAGELFDSQLRHQLQYAGEAGSGLSRAQGLFEELGHALFDAHFTAKTAGDSGALGFLTGDQIERLLHCGEAAARGGFLT